MVINNTNETIELVLTASVATNQASFSCSFNEFSTLTFSGQETNGVSNGTTAVTLISSPSSNYQRQMRELLVENNDTASITVIIRFNNSSITRTIMRATLGVGESLTYSTNDGWSCKSNNGEKKFYSININLNGNIKGPEFFPVANAASSPSLGTAVAGQYLGKAEKPYTSIDFRYEVVTAAATVTFCELAVYRISNRLSIGTQQVWTRLGFADTNSATSSGWTSIGYKTTKVDLTGCNIGDDLYAIWASNATTSMAPRGGNISDQTSSVLQVSTTNVANWRPSTSPLYQATSFGATASAVWFNWYGNI